MGLALDEPDKNDVVVTINDIQVAIDPDVEPYTEGLTLDYDQENNGLMLVGNESSCC
jgi:Fe-S cluster assembly iron-binding protein IscA